MASSDRPVFHLRYCHREPASWFLAGFGLLEQEGVLRIGSVEQFGGFLANDLYQHNNIIEARTDDALIVFDYETGTQSFLRMELFDRQLEPAAAYFKTNFRPDFFAGLENRGKVHPLVPGTFFATAPGNPYDRLYGVSLSPQGVRSFLSYLKHHAKHVRAHDYRNLLYCEHFSDYRILIWSRLFGLTSTAEHVRKTYPFLDEAQAEAFAKTHRQMLRSCEEERIRVCTALKKAFGSRVIGGLRDDEYTRGICPDLISRDECVATREGYHATMRSNVIGVATRGHNDCVEAKFGEMLAAGRAIVSTPVTCVMPGDFAAGKNYAEFTDTDALCTQIERLLHDPAAVHEMETANADYFRRYMAPRECVLHALQTAFPDHPAFQTDSTERKAALV